MGVLDPFPEPTELNLCLELSVRSRVHDPVRPACIHLVRVAAVSAHLTKQVHDPASCDRERITLEGRCRPIGYFVAPLVALPDLHQGFLR